MAGSFGKRNAIKGMSLQLEPLFRHSGFCGRKLEKWPSWKGNSFPLEMGPTTFGVLKSQEFHASVTKCSQKMFFTKTNGFYTKNLCFFISKEKNPPSQKGVFPIFRQVCGKNSSYHKDMPLLVSLSHQKMLGTWHFF